MAGDNENTKELGRSFRTSLERDEPFVVSDQPEEVASDGSAHGTENTLAQAFEVGVEEKGDTNEKRRKRKKTEKPAQLSDVDLSMLLVVAAGRKAMAKAEEDWEDDTVELADRYGDDLSKEDTRKLQTLLYNHGPDGFIEDPNATGVERYYSGPIDGERSLELEQAIDRFSRDRSGTTPTVENPVDVENLTTRNIIPREDGKWSLSVQMTGIDSESTRHDMAVGQMILVSPEGETYTYDVRSGGWGRYGDDSMLPGLDRDEMTAVSYGLDWDTRYAHNSSELVKGMLGANGRGSRIGLVNDDGVDTPRDLFAIHTDGNATGSLGCIVMDDNVTNDFFEMLESIPLDQRPERFHVLPPQDVIEQYIAMNPDADVSQTLAYG